MLCNIHDPALHGMILQCAMGVAYLESNFPFFYVSCRCVAVSVYFQAEQGRSLCPVGRMGPFVYGKVKGGVER